MTEPATGVIDAAALDRTEPEERAEPVWGAVVSLALGVFGLVTAEFLPASLLTRLAQDLGVSEGAAGQAVTATAVVGAIAAPTMAIVTKRLDRRLVMWILTVLLIVSNLLAAFASSLSVLLLARVVLGIALGGFWSMSAAMAMRLVPMRLVPRAMSIILTGVSVATVTAAPVGAYVGDIWGWRTAFMIAAVVGALTLLVQLATIPSLPPTAVASFRTLIEVLKRPTIRAALTVVLLVASGQFAGFTYVRPFLETVPVMPIETISLVLLAYGIGGFFGNFAGAFLAERSLKLAVGLAPLLIALSALVMLTLGASPAIAAIAVAAWGFAFGAVPVGLQTWLVRAAPDQAESAGGLMVATFQVAIALGAVFGGLLVDHAGVASAFAYGALATLLAALVTFAIGPRQAQ
ncbi:MFS transporter [Mesorhizobium sp. M1C.F.Ca.ET.193.01.1.1]|uniref:MFS transporter n=1 Tax=unclassified Mesorhizobium TaxID=325217 RepID=UPI000FD43DAA|nr:MULTISPECIES: MFS transporter [unclassified Mesorhizobium]TGS99142.1 MFS transporter [bacterium M00.F.Ca.ET.177.01.1.1]TGQ53290.1 MFS transporter [Mesorhizobium sp. M1C.F.Ca.ET.210.01.1.1]TGQ70558.1 MFS transporter [Mesorhizobium sp. M1C.F.Ca.ET.212.01.1.1]TGR07050.1 MFS transporter [Mesorhizobium sp. M1C.F.Ca.ET.204.01.1.1]TGR27622.1 MFS transporter [Mesorhizobium sp. M1C.F.Ca.ET.196.01.1.1]